jgi:hypothetical protein
LCSLGTEHKFTIYDTETLAVLQQHPGVTVSQLSGAGRHLYACWGCRGSKAIEIYDRSSFAKPVATVADSNYMTEQTRANAFCLVSAVILDNGPTGQGYAVCLWDFTLPR